MNSIDPLQKFLCLTPHFEYPFGFPSSPEEFQLKIASGTKNPTAILHQQIFTFYQARNWNVQLAPWSMLRNTSLDLQIFHPTEGFQLRYISATMLATSMEQMIITVGYIANPIEKDGIPFYIGEEIHTPSDHNTVLKITELGRSSVRAQFERVGYKYGLICIKPFDNYQICENDGGSWDIEGPNHHTIFVKIDQSGLKELELH